MVLKTESEWTQDVIGLLDTIHNKFPELSKFIEEMPVKSSSKSMRLPSLEEYHDSLKNLLRQYEQSHIPCK
jgi:hypothetical protein